MIGRRRSVRWLRTALASTALAALGGCTTLGANVKGSFSCAAPDGICAPSSSIDDRALAMIAGESGAAVPAGPVVDAASKARPSRTAAAASRPTIGRSDPQRTQERVLRIVFQPYIDEYGRLHEASAVHAVVAGGAWQQELLASSTLLPDRDAGPRPAPAESLAEAVDRADPPVADLAAIDPNLPDPAVVAAARARVPASDPVAAIKSEVAARLAPKAGRTPPRAVSKATATTIERKAASAPPQLPAASTPSLVVGGGAAPAAKGQADAALLAKTKSAAEATARVKATAEYQGRALEAEKGSREAAAGASALSAKPVVTAPVRAAGFPGAISEDK